MISSISMAFVAAFLAFLPLAALYPFYEKVCDEVECGKGTCKADIIYPFNYICECDPGWKRTKDDDVNNDLKFLPCLIPNCTLNYSCQPAPPPVPEKEVPYNLSAFDPCYWMYCGEGTCKQTEIYKHECKCNPGYSNLLNITYFPCYSNCTLGSDCASLGISVASTKTSETTDTGKANANTTATTDTGKAATFLPEKFQLVAVFIMSMAMVLWK
ncbi:hypothetical protein SLE2022_084760 [Rubroshorea leprosula]